MENFIVIRNLERGEKEVSEKEFKEIMIVISFMYTT